MNFPAKNSPAGFAHNQQTMQQPFFSSVHRSGQSEIVQKTEDKFFDQNPQHPFFEKVRSSVAAASTVQSKADDSRSLGGSSVAQTAKVIQRVINVNATQYQNRIAPNGLLTKTQLVEYIKFAVADDLKMAINHLTKEERGKLIASFQGILTKPAIDANDIGMVDAGVARINEILNEHQISNVNTRYAASPAHKYTHTNLRPSKANAADQDAKDAIPDILWDKEEDARSQFGKTAGNTLISADTPSVSPAAKQKDKTIPDIKQLTWEQAQEMLPRPLLNLLFDVKSQLTLRALAAESPKAAADRNANMQANIREYADTRKADNKRAEDLGIVPKPIKGKQEKQEIVREKEANARIAKANAERENAEKADTERSNIMGAMGDAVPVVDERSQDEKRVRNATPTEPGTLRSWHEDSKGILPANGFDKKKPNVSKEASALHTHYAMTSGSGTGAAAGAATSPTGFAEYTGAGANNIHNIKVVLDYMQKRVYLTFSHYQYWAIVQTGEGTEFVDGKTQEIDAAKGNIASDQKVVAAGGKYTLMNPWIEILVP